MSTLLKQLFGAGILAALTTGSYGATIAFDGVDDYINAGASVALEMTNQMTLEAWIMPTGPNTTGVIVGREGEYLLTRVADGTIQYGLNFTGPSWAYVNTGVTAPLNQWMHVALTYDANATGNRIRFYTNGVLAFSGPGSGNILDAFPTQDDFRIGMRSAAGNHFRGQIDEVRVWNVARTPAAVATWMNRPLAGNESGLVAYYRMDEGAGTATLDRTGHGLGGTLVGGPVWNILEESLDLPVAGMTTVSSVTDSSAILSGAINPNGVPSTNRFIWGRGSTALEFDGLNDFILVPNGPNLANRSFSIEFWARRDGTNLFEFPFSLGGSGTSRDLLHLGFRSATVMTFGFFGDDLDATVSGDDFAWHHWAFTYNSTNRQRRIYQDGLLVAEGIAGGNFVGVGSLRLGRYLASNLQTAFAGAMDEVRVWKDAVLNEATIRQWMNAEVNNTHTNLAALEAYWKLDEGSGDGVADITGRGFDGQFVDNPTWVPGARPVFDTAAPGQTVTVSTQLFNLGDTLSNLTVGTVHFVRTVAEGPTGASIGRIERFATLAPVRGTALAFDGQNDYVRVRGFGSNAPTTEVTVEFWQRVHSIREQSPFSLEPDLGGNRFQVNSPWSDGIVYWDFGNFSTTGRLSYLPPEPLVGRWNHFAFVASQTNGFMRIYRNGVLEASQPTMDPREEDGSFNLLLGRGTLGGAPRYFDGELDEFRIWNRARTQTEIQTDLNTRLTGNEINLVSYYRMDEGAGLVLVDSSLNVRNGSLTNGPAYLGSTAPVGVPVAMTLPATAIGFGSATLNGSVNGDGTLPSRFWFEYEPQNDLSMTTPIESLSIGRSAEMVSVPVSNLTISSFHRFRLVAANDHGTNYGATQEFLMPAPGARTGLEFDGINDYVNLGTNNALKITGNTGTWEAWIRPDAYKNMMILNKEGEYEIGLLANGQLWWALAITTSNWVVTQTGILPPLRQWMHVAFVYNGTSMVLYTNGVAARTNAASGPIGDQFTAYNEFRIGSRQNTGAGSSYWQGGIDEVRVWNIARSAAEIAASFNRRLILPATGLLVYLKFDEGGGTTAKNLALNIDGTLIGGPLWVPSAARIIDPVVATLPPSPVLATSATLRGTVNPSGEPVVTYFEYGETANYGSSPIVAGSYSSLATTPLSAALTGLEPGTTYHYRAVAYNTVRTNYGANQTFTTLVLGSGWPVSTKLSAGEASLPLHVLDGLGNTYVAGVFSGSAAFRSPLSPAGGAAANAFVGKMSRAADWLWTVNIPASSNGFTQIRAIGLDSARNIYVAGQFSGTNTFGNTNLISNNDTNLFVAKLDGVGMNWLWARAAGGVGPDSADALAVVGDQMFVAGSFSSTANLGGSNLVSAGGSDIFIASLDSNGNWLWANRGGGTSNDFVNTITTDASTNVYVAGQYSGVITNGLTTLTNAGGTDLFVGKLTRTGTWAFARRGGSANNDAATSLTRDTVNPNQFYLVGQFGGTADYGVTLKNVNTGSLSNLFLLKLDTEAVYLDYLQGGAGFARSVTVDALGRVYVAGDFALATSFGTNSLTSFGNTDVFLAQVVGREWTWAKQIGSAGTETAGSISADSDNSVVISGTYQGTIEIGYVALTSPNNQDIFVARLDAERVYEHNNYIIGEAIPVPVDAQDPDYGDGAIGQPTITILEEDPADSEVAPPFVWGIAEHKIFPVRQVTAIFKWPLTTNPTSTGSVVTAVGRTRFPTNPQIHVASAPVEVEPAIAGFRLRYLNVSFTTVPGATVDPGTKQFQAAQPGWSVLQFLDSGDELLDPTRHHSAFEVVRTVAWNDPAHLHDNQPAVIGTALTHPAHRDPTGKNGYVFFERALYDGAGEDRGYDRLNRTGPILPVNKDTGASNDDLVIIWYTNSVNGIAWPDKPVRYSASWPTNAEELVLASGAGSGVLDTLSYPAMRVYNQPNATLPGYNPNEEHAALYGSTLYALRNDLNAAIGASEPFVLLKYQDPANGQWAMKVFKVATTNTTFSFVYSGEAGKELLLPPPLSLLTLCGSNNHIVSGPGFKDYQGRLYARAAGSNSSGAVIVTRYLYPLQPHFFYDLDRNGQPDVPAGTCIPWLDRRASGTLGQSIDITYNITWPANVPVLQIGETLVGAKFDLPDLRRLANAQVIFDQANPNDTNAVNSLVRLFDPLAERTLKLPDDFVLPSGVGTAIQAGQKTFTDLPYAIRSRLFYDELNKRLSFKGLLDGDDRYGGPNNPLLLINVLSPRERDRITQLSPDTNFVKAIHDLYQITRNPNRLDLNRDDQPDQTLLIGLTCEDCQTNAATGAVTGRLVHEQLGDQTKALTAGPGTGTGFVTIAENINPALAGLPVRLHVIQVHAGPFRGDLKIILSDNTFDEKLTIRHSADFGGEPQRFEFEWYYQPDTAGFNPSNLPTVLSDGQIDNLNGWIQYTNGPIGLNGFNDITFGDGGESGLLVLGDNWIICRYRGYVIHGQTNWSDWAGAFGGGEAQFAEGWVKRVRDGLNPFEARSGDFHANETVTFASMLQQAGTRYERDIAVTPDAGNINSIGLIEAYETVLRRARRLSIDGAPSVNYQPANDALLLAAGFIADLYMLLGNEAVADAADPTIGFRTSSTGYGTLAPSIFTFQNQLDSLLEEELALLRGRDDRSATVRSAPVYNRLFWNFTRGEGEVAYAQSYNITDQSNDGFIDANDARIMYPQGHGDAWGHYLTATKTYYSLLQNAHFDWKPRTESLLLAGVPVRVDYLDERKFARAAAAKARTGAEIVDLTYRLNYVDDPAGQFQGYKDTDAQRAWGVSEWGHRAGSGALFDWLLANAILPALDPNTNHVGIEKVDRATVAEVTEIISAYESVQNQLDKADGGLNPLGLAKNVVPFDIDPSQVSAGNTHFEQIYARATEAVNNTVTVFNHANQLSQALRSLQDTVNDFSRNAQERERDYKNRMIEIFGYPYAGDIGAGRTYPSGYDGPDLYHYMYVNATELNGETAPPGESFTGFFEPMALTSLKFVLNEGRPGYRIETNLIDTPLVQEVGHYFPDDLSSLQNNTLATAAILPVSYPRTASDFGFVAPAQWGLRRAPGEIQMALSDVLQSEARLKQALINYDNLLKRIQDHLDLLEARHDVRQETFNVRSVAEGKIFKATAIIAGGKVLSKIMAGLLDRTTDIFLATVETIPKSVGTSSDALAPVRGGLFFARTGVKIALNLARAAGEVAVEYGQSAIADAKNTANLEIESAHFEFEIKQRVKELEQLIREEPVLRAEAYTLAEKLSQTSGRYQAGLAKGLRLAEERISFRKNTAADTQASRYQDMTFRIFRNDAIQKYRAQFDLAAQYVFLAAVAYDFETQLLGGRAGAGRAFLTDIVRQRALGEVLNGVPVAGRHGLADPLARLNQNFGVLKGQLGFNNPQTETGRFSLRSELFRMRDSSDESWRAELKKHIVPNLWDIPEFRRYCRPFAPESAGPQPGLVIRFPTTVTFGLNYFGWPLSGGDSSYDSTLFATKVRSAGLWFSDYNGSGLSLTPRVYLVPVGADVMRSPSSNNLETREWRVVDQKIPVPFPIGFSSLNNPAWIPMNDSLSDTFADIRRFSSFRAFHDKGIFDPAETISDSRLIGRSVWNTDWMLIIPGGTFLFDANRGLDVFINSVSDIKIFFQTYAYSGN